MIMGVNLLQVEQELVSHAKTKMESELFLLSYGFLCHDVDIENIHGVTPITLAIEEGIVSAVKSLLLDGASLTKMNSHGFSALGMITEKTQIGDMVLQEQKTRDINLHLKVSELLKRFPQGVNSSDLSGMTPLTLLAAGADYDLVRTVLGDYKGDPTLVNLLGQSPLDCASDNVMIEIISKSICLQAVSTFSNSAEKSKVLHASVEYYYGVGGLKAASTGMIAALNKSQPNQIAVVSPYWDFMDVQPDHENKVVMLGHVDHIYKRAIVSSAVYAAFPEFPELSNNFTIQYLIRPIRGSEVRKIFYIGSPANIYKAFEHSEPQNRVEYYNGAIASLVMLESDFTPDFTVLHTHGWQSALCQSILKEFSVIRPQLVSSGKEYRINCPLINHTVHMLTAADLGKNINDQTYQSVGLDRAGKPIEQQFEVLLSSDSVNFVSRGLKNSVLKGEPYACGYSKIFKAFESLNSLHGITNGIDCMIFSPANPVNLDGQPMEVTFNDKDDVYHMKTLCKQYLSEHLKDNVGAEMAAKFAKEKPLMIYVGRYSKEKGIDLLELIADTAANIDMQFIVMGIYSNEHAKPFIAKLKERHDVVVLDRWAGEQKSLGRYIRQAADITICPSHAESCGLVPMEALGCGSIPVTSDVQGLTDSVIDIDSSSGNGNGFVYREEGITDRKEIKRNLIDAITKAKEYLDDSTKDIARFSLWLSSLVYKSLAYDWSKRPVNHYIDLYNNLLNIGPNSMKRAMFTIRPDLTGTRTIGLPMFNAASAPVPPMRIIEALHVSMEFEKATLGGLGSVVNELCESLTAYPTNSISVITPHYPKLYTCEVEKRVSISHIYNGEMVTTQVFCRNYRGITHFMVSPHNAKYRELFNILSEQGIYSDLKGAPDSAIERMKYFNSAVAGFITHPDVNTDADAIIDYLLFSKDYISKCEERHGVDAVESMLDSCHALMNYGVDRYKKPAKLSIQEEKLRQTSREEYIQSQVNDLWRTIPLKAEKVTKDIEELFLAEPEENILYFVEKNAPILEPWQREIIRIVRKTSQYFYPQKQTKVMNEGWATFWHYTIINTLFDRGKLTESFMMEFLHNHTNVVYQPEFDSPYFSGINPYTLGFNMFQDIRRICESPTPEDRHWFPDLVDTNWLETLDFAMRNFKDESFIAQYLSPKVIRDLKLFSLLDSDKNMDYEVTHIHNEDGYQIVRELLAKQYNLSFIEPNIQVHNINFKGDRSITLRHVMNDRRKLEPDSAQEVLKHLHHIWGFDCYLHSIDENDMIVDKYQCPIENNST